MPKYDIPVWEMCKEAAKELPEIFGPIDVIRKVKEKRPEVKANTIRCHVIGCSPNHPSSKHYSIRHNLFYYLGNGRYRLLKTKEEIPKEFVSAPTEEIPLEEEIDAGFSFEFEADLEGHLANNLDDIEGGLKLYVSDEGITGRQFSTGVGRIDMLALDRDGNFVVIEIKVGQATDKSCFQILRYIGWVKRHIARERKVRGIIICRNATDGLKYATSTLENVGIKEYEAHFSFQDADLDIEEEQKPLYGKDLRIRYVLSQKETKMPVDRDSSPEPSEPPNPEHSGIWVFEKAKRKVRKKKKKYRIVG